MSCPGSHWGSHVAARCRTQDGGLGSQDWTRWDRTGTHSLWLYKPRYPAGCREQKHFDTAHILTVNTHSHTVVLTHSVSFSLSRRCSDVLLCSCNIYSEKKRKHNTQHIQHTNKIKTNMDKYMEKAQIHPTSEGKKKDSVIIYEKTERSTCSSLYTAYCSLISHCLLFLTILNANNKTSI